jgi:hypothetical protein
LIETNYGKIRYGTVLIGARRNGLNGYFSYARLCLSHDELAFFIWQRRFLLTYFLVKESHMSLQKTTEKSVTGNTAISDETVLKISKEIAVKFIEVGRISPATFGECFKDIYTAIETTVRKN